MSKICENPVTETDQKEEGWNDFIQLLCEGSMRCTSKPEIKILMRDHIREVPASDEATMINHVGVTNVARQR
jgi:hypothetical protein